MFGSPVTNFSAGPPPAGILDTLARLPIGPSPPKFTGSGTVTVPGGPDSAT